MNTSLPVRDPFYSIFAVAAVMVLGIAAFTSAGSESASQSEQVASQSVVVAPRVADASSAN
jgi:hypothetical protein